MKKSAGLLLIVFGLIVLVWGAFGITTREKVLDVGPIHATKETTHYLPPYAPIVGVIALIGGAAVLVSSRTA